MTVPEDLQRIFDGKSVIAERHGMPRVEDRWRVVDVIAVHGTEENPYVVRPIGGEIREFKTLKAAEKYRDARARSGRTVLMQHGITFWPDPDEWPQEASDDDPS